MKRLSAIAALVLLPLVSCSGEKEKSAPDSAAKPDGSAKVEKVRLKTSKGDIVIELNRAKAPITVENFLSYVNKKHYDGTVFHRVIPTFMIQGGGYALTGGKLVEKPVAAPIKNEGQNGLKNLRGSIAMARTNVIDSATSQFFINVQDNPALNYPNNGGYAVFGTVVEGMDVVDKIKAVATGSGATASGPPLDTDVPVEPIVIKSATAE